MVRGLGLDTASRTRRLRRARDTEPDPSDGLHADHPGGRRLVGTGPHPSSSVHMRAGLPAVAVLANLLLQAPDWTRASAGIPWGGPHPHRRRPRAAPPTSRGPI